MGRKLIETALPLEIINRASERETNLRGGHPRMLHVWWSRKPLATARAVLFAALVDDPGARPDRFPTEADQDRERQRLFELISRMVDWERIGDTDVLAEARRTIHDSQAGDLPPVLDPFCGAGSIPYEAQRLGLTAHGSDLNPVAVLLTKALTEHPSHFPPDKVANEVRKWGAWIRSEAVRRVGHLYPPTQDGRDVRFWLWARTVACPNPACGRLVPLVGSWQLARTPEAIWVALEGDRFTVRRGRGEIPPETAGREGVTCPYCKQHAPLAHVRAEGLAGRMGNRLLAQVSRDGSRPLYLDPEAVQEAVALSSEPPDVLDAPLVGKAAVSLSLYGLSRYRDIYSSRQLTVLSTLSGLVREAAQEIRRVSGDAYARAIATYLSLAVGKLADRCSALCGWDIGGQKLGHVFFGHALPMMWHYVEGNPLGAGAATFDEAVEGIVRTLGRMDRHEPAFVSQQDATRSLAAGASYIISTDPPYDLKIDYADLSDYFYVWHRLALEDLYPDLFGTLLTPKEREIVATPYHFGGNSAAAKSHFQAGLAAAFRNIRQVQHPDYPLTLYYAAKQTATAGPDGAPNAWELMLTGLMEAGFMITGTWPMHTESLNRRVAQGTNALAASILLVCRPRPEDSPIATTGEFLAALREEMPIALRRLQHGNIAPVDLAQAAIGPGMAIFSRFLEIRKADGRVYHVRDALAAINQILGELVSAQEHDFDPESRWALHWFESLGFQEGPYYEAEQLTRAVNSSVDDLVLAGIVHAKGGRVRLLSREELPGDWSPRLDLRKPHWEATQHLIKRLATGGEVAAAWLLLELGELGDYARELAYQLYLIAEKRKWPQEAILYNGLVVAWPELRRLAQGLGMQE